MPDKELETYSLSLDTIKIDKETARELLTTLEHQFINYKYTKVHQLILELQKFIGEK